MGDSDSWAHGSRRTSSLGRESSVLRLWVLRTGLVRYLSRCAVVFGRYLAGIAAPIFSRAVIASCLMRYVLGLLDGRELCTTSLAYALFRVVLVSSSIIFIQDAAPSLHEKRRRK